MRLIGKHLRVDFAKCFLFDDSSDHHANRLGLTMEQAHMISTQPFDFDTMSREQRMQLYETLSQHFYIDAEFKEDQSLLISAISQKTNHKHMPSFDKDNGWIQFHIMYPTDRIIEWYLGSIF